jgi:hypothetical protein
VAWESTVIDAGEEISAWLHTFSASFRPAGAQDPASVVSALVNGKPTGENLPWRYCPVTDGTLPPEVESVERIPDEEQVDVFQVKFTIRETGD